MTEDDWTIVLKVFAAAQSRRGQPGRDDRKFLEALHFFTVHNLTWRALPAAFGAWNSIRKRFWRLSRMRWSPSVGQFGGLDKLDSGCRQAANFSVPVALYASSGVRPASIEWGR
ncbi:MAG TPA: transposase, partial [Acetobacteraceae bacterium]